MTRNANAYDPTGEWYSVRLLYPLYTALGREFVIDLTACSDLEGGADPASQKSIETVRKWFQDIDQRIQVYQLRQFLQMTSLTSEEGLATWLQHHLRKPKRTDSDRDKIDFLLVQDLGGFCERNLPSRPSNPQRNFRGVIRLPQLQHASKDDQQAHCRSGQSAASE